MKPSFSLFAFCAALTALAGCSLAPDYQVPETPNAATFKESGDWMKGEPAAAAADAWWKVYGDAQLNALEDQVTAANQNLKAAVAQYDQARAQVDIARAAYFPAITGDVSATRQRNSHTVANPSSVNIYNDFTGGADLSYEIDLWGRVRNTVAANKDQAEANADDLADVTLSLHADLASDYFALRGDDEAQLILDHTVRDYEKALQLTQDRFKGGASPESDVDQAETQLANAKTQASDMRLQRAQLEHAIAILTGKAPAEFTLVPAPIAAHPALISADVPSALLQRRPDIAAAERRVAAANAEIGVARAAWFPVFNLTASLGLQSATGANWIQAPSRFWTLGPSMMLPIFEGGQLEGLNAQARAAYDQSAAEYRQTVLNAYGEVEDNLVALHRLDEEEKTQNDATRAAKRSLSQANDLYKNGANTYLDVVVTENSELQAELAAVTIKVRQLTADVQLIKALGGGWKLQPAAD